MAALASSLQGKNLSITTIYYCRHDSSEDSRRTRSFGFYDVIFRFFSKDVMQIVRKELESVKENPFAFELTEEDLPFSLGKCFFLKARPLDPNSQETCVACYARVRQILEKAGFRLPSEDSGCILPAT